MATPPNSFLSSLSLSQHSKANPIDLTQDEDEDSDGRFAKRQCTNDNGVKPFSGEAPPFARNSLQFGSLPVLTGSGPSSPFPLSYHPTIPHFSSPPIYQPNLQNHAPGAGYSPVFSGPSTSSAFFGPPVSGPPPPASARTFQPTALGARYPHASGSSRPVIDLTSSPSPPPSFANTPLPDSLEPKTPVCIGQLQVTALVIYHIPYLLPQGPVSASGEGEWATVRLQYEHNPLKPGHPDTIHIRTPSGRYPNGDVSLGENFGAVEQKVATHVGPMLGKGLIRLDAKVKRSPLNLPILPLQILVYTPKGNIPVVGSHLLQWGLLLDHPTPPYDKQRFSNYHYYNPHNPPPGGHNRSLCNINRSNNGSANNISRWGNQATPGKSVEVQRHQVDELFKSLKGGDELVETEPTFEVASKLYPHQKKALTYLLEREREKPGPDGTYSSLWQPRVHPLTNQTLWYHVVTQKETLEEPRECKGALLADDMGLGKTITCVSLIASTLKSAEQFASESLDSLPPPSQSDNSIAASHFSNAVWGMPEVQESTAAAKKKAKAARLQEKLDNEYTRACRIKVKSRATLIVCPLTTVANWEDQFREHWKGEVKVVGGAGGVCVPPVPNQALAAAQPSFSSLIAVDDPDSKADIKSECTAKAESPKLPPGRVREGRPLNVYVYHGNARRPEPSFLANFDAVITTYATLASEFSKQNRSLVAEDGDEEGEEAMISDGEGSTGGVTVDEKGNPVLKLPTAKAKKSGLKRKKSCVVTPGQEATSALQSVHWFRVVLDEAHYIKETGTVGSRACCDLIADRRLCLTGTPVQNKLDDIFALIKFLRLEPFRDKNVWTEFIGGPVKHGQTLGVARLQTIMKCITLRRTKESKTADGERILALPPRRDELRLLKFDEQEQGVYQKFFEASRAEFNELSTKNEVMKNYVGILQKILRLRQICDHYELVEGKGPKDGGHSPDSGASYESIAKAIREEGLNPSRASAIFNLLRESATAQCVECGFEFCSAEPCQGDIREEGVSAPKKGRKVKACSRAPTRPSSPSGGVLSILTRCQHLFCLHCYQTSICPQWPNVPSDARYLCSVCQSTLASEDAIEVKQDLGPAELTLPTKKKSEKKGKKSKGVTMENFHPSTKIKALLSDLVQFSRSNPHSSNFDPSTVEVQMIDEKGNDLDDAIVKTVVFSQWTSMLDKVEDALDLAGIRYERLDGTMKRDDRTRAMETLKRDPSCEVLLVSLKAGGVGLNLTAAQRVYLMDPYWNPAVENQAVDRIHRLGQTRPVTTVKLIIEGSIEARLLEVQKKKTALANLTLGQHFTKSEMMARRMDELNQLFGN